MRLYGPDDTLENAFADLEGLAADLFRRIVSSRKLPQPGTPDRDLLVAFAGLQLARTIGARTAAMKMSDSLSRAAYGEIKPEMSLSQDQAMAISLAAAPQMIKTLRDLGGILISAPAGTNFITSDSPVFRYNTYCEGLSDFGVTGTTQRGLQLLFPLTPRLSVMLYDSGVYKVGSRRAKPILDASKGDVTSLNRLQCVSATQNAYFHDWQVADELFKIAQSVDRFRGQLQPRYHKAAEDGDSNSELIHQYWPMPQIDLELSFLSIQRNARRIPLFDRAQLTRPAHRSSQSQQNETGTVRRFSVRSRG